MYSIQRFLKLAIIFLIIVTLMCDLRWYCEEKLEASLSSGHDQKGPKELVCFYYLCIQDQDIKKFGNSNNELMGRKQNIQAFD